MNVRSFQSCAVSVIVSVVGAATDVAAQLRWTNVQVMDARMSRIQRSGE